MHKWNSLRSHRDSSAEETTATTTWPWIQMVKGIRMLREARSSLGNGEERSFQGTGCMHSHQGNRSLPRAWEDSSLHRLKSFPRLLRDEWPRETLHKWLQVWATASSAITMTRVREERLPPEEEWHRTHPKSKSTTAQSASTPSQTSSSSKSSSPATTTSTTTASISGS